MHRNSQNLIISFIMLCLVLGGIAILFVNRKPDLITTGAYSWAGDANFEVTSLAAPVQFWHQRTLEIMANPDNQWPGNPHNWVLELNTACDNNRSEPNAYGLYSYGRNLADYIYALLAAFRATKDPVLLAEVDSLVEQMRDNLQDTNNDGYLNWVYTHHSGGETHCNKDVHLMDEIFTHTLIANVAYIYSENEHLNPTYAQRAEFWTDYLENHFVAKWQARSQTPEFGWVRQKNHTFPVFKLTHPYVASIRLYHYLYKLTGNKSYRDEALSRHDYFFDNIDLVDGAYRWRHNIFKELNSNSQAKTADFNYWQETAHYSRYTTEHIVDLHYEQVGQFAQTETMERFAKSWAKQIYNDDVVTMAEFTDGAGSTQFMVEKSSGIARWGSRGKLQCLVVKAHGEQIVFGESVPKPKIHEAAWMTLNAFYTGGISYQSDCGEDAFR